MWIDQRGSEVLSRNECLRLLAVGAGGVARLGHVEDDRVVIQPVNYRMLDSDLVVQVGPGSILDIARAQTIVGVEVDEVSVTSRSAWSVLVQGLASVIEDPTRAERARPSAGRPLVPEPGTSFVRIRTGVLSGRRFELRPDGPATGKQADADRVALGGDTPLADIELRPPTRVARDASVRQVAGVMEDQKVSAVVVGEHPSWLVTERDLVGALAAGLDPDKPAAEVATKAPIWATTSTSLDEALAMMVHHGVRHLLVITPGGEPLGTLPLLDALGHRLPHIELHPPAPPTAST